MACKRIKVNIDWKGLQCEGTVVFGDTSGDRSVPGGEFELAPYVEDLEVLGPEGDIMEYLSSNAIGIIEDIMIEETYDRGLR